MRKFLRTMTLVVWLVSGGKLFWWGIRKSYTTFMNAFTQVLPNSMDNKAKRIKLKKKYRYLIEHGQDKDKIKILLRKSLRYEKIFSFLSLMFWLLVSIGAMYLAWRVMNFWDQKLF